MHQLVENDMPLGVSNYNKALDSGSPAQYLPVFEANVAYCASAWSSAQRERDEARLVLTRINDRRAELSAEREQLRARHRDAVSAAALARFQDNPWKALYNEAQKFGDDLSSLDSALTYSMVTAGPEALRLERTLEVRLLEARRDAQLAVGLSEKLKTICSAIAAGLDAQLDLSESHGQKMIAGAEQIEREVELARRALDEITPK